MSMRSFSLVFLLIFLIVEQTYCQESSSLPDSVPEEVGISSIELSQIDAKIQKHLKDKRIAGAVTIVARKGKVVHFKAHGQQNIKDKLPMKKDTIFRIYSMTKAVASVAILMLVEDGKIDLDAPASTYLPELKQMKVGKVPQKREMTTRDLLRHTAGFPNNVTTDRAFTQKGLPSIKHSTLEEMMNRLRHVPLIYQPGTKWHYSFGTEVLARLVEIVSEKPFDVFLSERIFKPLKMVDSGFHVPKEKRHRFSPMYGRGLREVDAPQPGITGKFTFEKNPKFLSAGGGLVSTATDFMRFLLMLEGQGELEGKRFLKSATVEEMTKNQLPKGLEIHMGAKGRGFSLGFAVRIRKIDSAPSSVGEYEWYGGAGTEYWVSPKDELVVITLTQMMPMVFLSQEIKPIVYGSIIKDKKASTYNPKGRKNFLLLDSRIIESKKNAILTLGRVTKDKSNPLFVADKPWEPRYDNMYPNVIYDEEEKLYKCWYCPFIVDERTSLTPKNKRNPESTHYMSKKPNKRDEAILYATSKDGIHWEKPNLGIVEFNGNKKNNIVVRGPSGAGVYKDNRDPDPNKRYKAFYAAQVGYMQLVRFSPDGLNWGPEIKCPEIQIQSDCHANLIWSDQLKKYVGIVRHYDRVPVVGNRKIARTESQDGVKWTKSELIISGHPQKQAHDMVIFEDGGVFLGLIGMMYFPSNKSLEGVRQHIELAWSPDSLVWHRIFKGMPLVSPSPTKERKYGRMPYDWGALFPSQPVLLKDEIRIYYGASDWYFFDWRKSGLALARMRNDGWAGYEPNNSKKISFVQTIAFDFPHLNILVNADIQSGGRMIVRLLNANNQQLAESIPLQKSVSSHKIRWKELPELQKDSLQGLKLKFELTGTKVYSFDFE